MPSDVPPLPSPGTPEWAWLLERFGPVDELGAMFDFADALRRHLGHRCSSPERGHQGAPDYWSSVDGQRIGVEVTILRASERLLGVNARVDAVLEYLKIQLRGVETCPAVDLLYDPDSADGVPRQGHLGREFQEAIAVLKQGYTPEALQLASGRLILLRASPGKGPVRVMHQGFFAVSDSAMWEEAVNEAICRKLGHYGARFCSPCWLVLNLKPYLRSEADSRTFLSCNLRVWDEQKVRTVFDRVYALTAYISDDGRGPTCPVRRVL
jgi:hypothetical protein